MTVREKNKKAGPYPIELTVQCGEGGWEPGDHPKVAFCSTGRSLVPEEPRKRSDLLREVRDARLRRW